MIGYAPISKLDGKVLEKNTHTNILDDITHPFTIGISKVYMLKNNPCKKSLDFFCSGNLSHFAPVIEGAFLGGSKSKSTSEVDNSQDISLLNKDISKTINEDFKKNMSSILQKNSVDISNESSQEMKQFLAQSNKALFSDINTGGGDFNMDLSQSNKAEIEATMKAESFTMNSVNNKVSNKTDQQFNDIMQDGEKMGELLADVVNNAVNEAAGVVNNTVDAAAGVANTGINAAAGVASDYIAGATATLTEGIKGVTGGSTNTSSNVDNSIKSDTKNIKATTDINKKGMDIQSSVETAMDNKITNETLQQCASEVSQANETGASGVDTEGGNVNINVDQENAFGLVLDCQFKTETMNTVVNDMINEMNASAEKQNLSPGTIEAAGVAMAVAAQGVGDGIASAAEGTGEGVATAAKGAGDGVASAAEGVGNMFASMWLPLTIVIILALLYAAYRFGLFG